MKNKLKTFLMDKAEMKIINKNVKYKSKYIEMFKFRTNHKLNFEERN